MSYQVKSQKLGEELLKAERADGYLIMITRLQNGRLHHSWVTEIFPKEDFIPSLERQKQLLKGEMPPTTIKKIEVPEKERKLPPEYRPENINKPKKKTVKARLK